MKITNPGESNNGWRFRLFKNGEEAMAVTVKGRARKGSNTKTKVTYNANDVMSIGRPTPVKHKRSKG